MARFRPKKTGLIFTVVFIAVIVSAIAVTLSSYGVIDGLPTWSEILDLRENTSDASSVSGGQNKVCFIDCGQGDCEALISADAVTVIDAGPAANKYNTVQELKNAGISKIDNFILTHPHEDHIGGAVQLLNSFEVGSVYMMKPSASNTPNTQTYLNLLETIGEKGLSITQPQIGSTIQSGDFMLKFISPSKDYDDHNNNSIVIRASVGGKSFLFTGDAESKPETDMIKNYKVELDCDVLKVGHHGSKTSTGKKFYNAVSPQICVISCGEDNDYGHPHGETLKTLADSTVYRTDINGTVTITVSDGELIVSAQKEG